MIEPAKDAAVLQPVRLGAAGEALRRRIDRRHLLLAIAAALLFHLLIVFGFLLMDRLRIRDIGDWSGPVLVKIGIPDAPESSAPDPGPLPEQIDTPEQPDTPVPDIPSESVEEAVPGDSTPVQPKSTADSMRPAEDLPTSETSVPEARPAPEPVPSRVRGSEDGNNYFIDFEGSDEEVGRNYSIGYVTDYMPLPDYLESSLVDNAGMNGGMSQDDLLRYWEPTEGGWGYRKKKGWSGFVPFEQRPFLWSYLVDLGYDIAEAEWRSLNLQPVVVEFTVNPPDGARGAFLYDIEVIDPKNDERIIKAVVYGLSMYNFYNRTDEPISGTFTYRFNSDQ